MSFFTLLIALMLEQARAVQSDHPVHGWMLSWVEWVRRHFDAGQKHHAQWAWALAVLLPASARVRRRVNPGAGVGRRTLVPIS